ncbi:ATP-binding protein [Desulfogranum japonicum]|uniref:ATP-binding protein n=1 Tax=Desulfogranum japonicum TaxID=231447 RepID=UPI00042559F4|nr:ATP-binding protein [Desulfogranum japonicum]
MKVRFTLTHKLFAAFLLILAIVVGAMFLARHIFFYNFRTYIRQVEVEKLQALVPALQQEYLQYGNWQGITSDVGHWSNVLSIASEIQKVIPPPGRRNGKKTGGAEVLLCDAQLNPVIGSPEPDDYVQLVPVEVDNRIVGWLGLEKKEPLRSGLPAALIKRQTQHLVILCLVVVALTGLIAYLFSRQMVYPIRELIRGTRELTNRNFHVLVKTGTVDEFGQLAEHFNSMAQTLRHYESMRRQWLTDISHELRTPLAVLRGEIEAIQDGIREPSDENLASLHVEVVRISTLVEDLHQLSLADSYSFCFEKTLVDIHRLLKESVDGYQVALQKKEIHVHLALDAPVEMFAYADADRMMQVFGNILANCSKYCKRNAEVYISTWEEQQTSHICIEDSGPGVEPTELGRIFDRLYRVDDSRNREFGGSGLGLSICKQIIEGHGGTIWAKQSDKGGLAICISLPTERKKHVV